MRGTTITAGETFYRTYAFDADTRTTGLYFRACEPINLEFGSTEPNYYDDTVVDTLIGRISNISDENNDALSEASKDYVTKIFRLLLTNQKTRWMVARVWPAPDKVCFALTHRTLQDGAISWEKSEIQDAGQAILDELQKNRLIRLTIKGDNCSRSDDMMTLIEMQCRMSGETFCDRLHIRVAHDPRESDFTTRDWAYVSLVHANGRMEEYDLHWQDEKREDIIALISKP